MGHRFRPSEPCLFLLWRYSSFFLPFTSYVGLSRVVNRERACQGEWFAKVFGFYLPSQQQLSNLRKGIFPKHLLSSSPPFVLFPFSFAYDSIMQGMTNGVSSVVCPELVCEATREGCPASDQNVQPHDFLGPIACELPPLLCMLLKQYLAACQEIPFVVLAPVVVGREALHGATIAVRL